MVYIHQLEGVRTLVDGGGEETEGGRLLRLISGLIRALVEIDPPRLRVRSTAAINCEIAMQNPLHADPYQFLS